MMDRRRIRPIVICILSRGAEILVGEQYDRVKGQTYYRPPGGGIRFGERSEEALVREMWEELGVRVTEPRLLGVLENLFTCEGQRGHEVVFVYDARLGDTSAYERDELEATESDGQAFRAFWRPLGWFCPARPLYPEGLGTLLLEGSTGRS